jgi:molecular chaperone IbpA
MRSFDLSPYRRTTVGFDRLFDFLESATRSEPADNYPPFDIEKVSDDSYRITLAVAGFKQSEIDITARQNLLLVTGRKEEKGSGTDGNYLYRGLAARAFERRFELADFVRVDGAELRDGLLSIELVREIPEAMKPRKIAINGGSSQTIEGSGEGQEQIGQRQPDAERETEAA